MNYRKIMLSLLSLTPIASVSMAAHSALADETDQQSVTALAKSVTEYRKLIFEKGVAVSSIGEAMNKFNATKAVDSNLEFWSVVEKMENEGMLQRHGEFLLAKTPSQY